MERKTWGEDGGGDAEGRVDRKPDGSGAARGSAWEVEDGVEIAAGSVCVRELDDASMTNFAWDGGAEVGMRSAKRTPISLSDANDAGDSASEVRV